MKRGTARGRISISRKPNICGFNDAEEDTVTMNEE